MTLLFSFQMTCIGSKIRGVILIPVILADFVINLGEFCGLEPPKLDYLCFRKTHYVFNTIGFSKLASLFSQFSENFKFF